MLNPSTYTATLERERANLRSANSLDELNAVLGRITQLQEAHLEAAPAKRTAA